MPFIILLACFYIAYPFLAAGAGGVERILADHWPIAVTMIAGSYFAGSTPVGGGSVAFPILVLLFDHPASLGRAFSFSIQALGMSVATVYLLCLRRTIARRFLIASIIGSAITTPLGCLFLAPLASDSLTKLIFATVWCAFGLFALTRLARFRSSTSADTPLDAPETLPGVLVGAVAGGLVASLIGGGGDMVAFSYLVFARRMDPRIAIPTAMILMAVTSIIALITTLATTGLPPGVWENWLAAAPIVVIGAPIGALMVGFIPRHITMFIVAALCLGQFLWTHWNIRTSDGAQADAWPIIASIAAVCFLFLILHGLERRR